MVKALQPMLTLRLGGVDFCLIPNENDHNGQVSFRKEHDEVIWTLSSFSGTLRVAAAPEADADAETSITIADTAASALSSKSTSTKADLTARVERTTASVARTLSKKSTPSTAAATTKTKETTSLSTAKRITTAAPSAQEPPAAKKTRHDSNDRASKETSKKSKSKASHKKGTDEDKSTSTSSCFNRNNYMPQLQEPTWLGQPDLSQSQRTTATITSFGADNDEDHQLMKDPSDEKNQQPSEEEDEEQQLSPSSKIIQDIMDNAPSNSPGTYASSTAAEEEEERTASQQQPTQDRLEVLVQDEPVTPKAANTETTHTTTGEGMPPRVSIGPMSPTGTTGDVANRISPPCARWGHTMTQIGSKRLVLYGGQTLEKGSYFPKPLQDVMVYDYVHQTWSKPYNCEGLPRQWHTCTYLPDRQLLIAFGGETVSSTKPGANQKVKTCDTVMVLDTEIMLWYPPSISGDKPSARSGHTATLVENQKEMVVFGGVKGSKWLNTVYVLDVDRWKWNAAKVQGVTPRPRSYHTATALPDHRIVIFGGNDADSSFNSVHVLQQVIDDDSTTGSSTNKCWRWTNPTCNGTLPSPRTGHSATLLSDQKTICVYGGWDPNTEEEVSGSDDTHMFSSDCCFLLDTNTWTWRKGGKLLFADLPAQVQGANGGEKRAGHAAALVKRDTDEVLIFGGRIPGDSFSGDFQSLTDF